jgi:site-specific DNA recombinase
LLDVSTTNPTDDYYDLDDLEEVLARDYLRVSTDRSGVMRSPGEQHTENAELCDRKRWALGESYTDEGSASTFQRKRRDDFDRLLSDLRADRFGAHVLIIWEVSRGTRQPGEMEELLALCQRRGVWLYVFNKRRLFNPRVVDDWEDLMHAVVKAAGESMRTSERSRRAGKADAKAGRATGGRRPFGFVVDRGAVTIDDDEAEIIREAARLVLGGKTTRWVAGELNRRGVLTSAGNPWHPGVLRKMLQSPRLAGHRVRGDEIALRDAWEPIIDDVTHRRLVAALATQPRGPRSDSPWVLTGFLRCELCGGPLSGHADVRGVRRYRCRQAPGYTGCGGLAIKSLDVEQRIGDLVMLRLVDTDERRRAGGDVTSDAAELAELDEIAELTSELVADRAKGKRAGGIDAAEYRAIKDQLDARKRDVNARIAAKTRETSELAFVIAENYIGRPWKSLSVDEQRDVLKAYIEHVTIGPATVRGSTRFETARVDATGRIIWKA